MNYEWQAAQVFERVHAVIGAINTISIHTKLMLSGKSGVPETDDIAEARGELVDFIGALARAVEAAERDRDRIVFGVDPRLNLLTQQVIRLRCQYPQRSAFSRLPFSEMRSLLESPTVENSPRLLSFLADLRRLIESHAHADLV